MLGVLRRKSSKALKSPRSPRSARIHIAPPPENGTQIKNVSKLLTSTSAPILGDDVISKGSRQV
ncbi:unnamed protein product [Heterosigma akashiwo]